MATNILTQEYVLSAIQSEKAGTEFPIDFDDVWESSGYTRRNNAFRFLQKRLKLNRDYRCSDRSSVLELQKTFLTVDGYKFFLAKSNTEQGDRALWHFIAIEKAYLATLEAALAPAPSPIAHLERSFAQSEKARAEVNEALDLYPNTLERLWKTSGIKSKSQVQRALKASFMQNRDWMLADGRITMKDSTFSILILSFRSADGVDLADLPSIISVETERYFQFQRDKRINSRIGKRDVCDGQMDFLDDLS
jgi:hypothetical protein